MNKNEFLDQLREALLRLSKSDRDDILLDYEEHFRAGEEKGMSEEEVAESLGAPASIAAQYLENLPEDAKGAPAAVEEEVTALALPELTDGSTDTEEAVPVIEIEADNAEDAEKPAQHISGGRRFGAVAFTIGAIVTVIALIYCWIGMLCAVIGCFAAAAALGCVSFIFISNYFLAFLGLLLIALGFVFFAIILIYALKYSMRGLKKLIRLFKNVRNKILGRA